MSEPNEVTPNSSTDEIRADIAQSRADLAATVDELTDRLDVKARAGEKVAAAKTKVGETAASVKQRAPEPVQHALDRAAEKAGPVAAQVAEQARPHRGKIIAAVAAGAVVLLIVRKRRGS